MFCLHCQETLDKFAKTPKVVIASINGHCVGGGLEIALVLRPAHDGEGFRADRTARGDPRGPPGHRRNPAAPAPHRHLPGARHDDHGKLLTPDEALAIGLVNYVYPKESFAADVAQYAAALAHGPARAVSLIKRSVLEGVEMPLVAGLALERELQNRLFVTEDAKEGLSAFAEKRKPNFKGR